MGAYTTIPGTGGNYYVGLPTLMYTLGLLPDSEGFTVEDAIDPTIITMLDGGAPRVRLSQIGAVKLVTCQWTVDQANHDALWAFYRTGALWGSQPFYIPLVGVDGSELTTYVAWFVPRTFKLMRQEGLTFVMGCQMYVLPNIPNPTADLALFSTWSE
ncbi:MAG: hypothetical protein WAN50_00275 [Minisyncoccia bacterium]